MAWSSLLLLGLLATSLPRGARAATVAVLTDSRAWAAATAECPSRWRELSLPPRKGGALRDLWRRLIQAEAALEVLDFAAVERALAEVTAALRVRPEAPSRLRWRVATLRWRLARLREEEAAERDALGELVRLAALYPEHVHAARAALRRALAEGRERYEREGWLVVRLVPTPLTGPTLDPRGRLRLPRALLPVTVPVYYPRVGWLSVTLPWRAATSHTVTPLAGPAAAHLVPAGVAVWARDATGPALWVGGVPRWRPGEPDGPCRYAASIEVRAAGTATRTEVAKVVASRPPGTGTTGSVGTPRWPWAVGALVAAGMVAGGIWWASRPPPAGALVVRW